MSVGLWCGCMSLSRDCFNVEKGERLKASLLFLWLFFFICSYYVLRPIRRGLVLEGLGNDNMPFVYMGTAVVTGLVVWIYSKYAHLPRRQLITTIYGIFVVSLLGWWQAFQHDSPLISGAFWVWLDVFSIMGVTVFWMYANDLCDSASAKRLFGIISAGGGLGAVVGSSLTAGLVQHLGAVNMLLVAAGIVAATMGLFLVMETLTSKERPKKAPSLDIDSRKLTGIGQICSTILSNKLLLFLTIVVCLERTVPDFIQFVYHEVLNTLATGHDAIAALDANLERWRAIGEFCIELFVVSAVLKRFGTSFSLSSSGIAVVTGLVSFLLLNNPIVMLVLFHTDETLRHAWFKAAKELTYTVTGRDVLYTVKPVIEMFFYRFARGFAGVVILLVNTVCGFGTRGVVVAGIVLGACWAWYGVKLSREYMRLEAARELEKSLEAKESPQKLVSAA